jgi:RNA polymerase sigma-70 factor, ECF subfamily
MPKPIPQPAPIDHALLALAALSDEHAWRTIAAKVWRRVGVILGARSPDVADITQEVCFKIRVALKFDQHLHYAEPAAWVASIATNTALDHLRKSKRWDTVIALDGDFGEWDIEEAEPQVAVEDVWLLENALGALSEKNRVIILMLYVDEYTYKEVAEYLRIPENTVKSRAARSVEKLRSYLQGSIDFEDQIARLRL